MLAFRLQPETQKKNYYLAALLACCLIPANFRLAHSISAPAPSRNPVVVYIFLAEDCKICQSYTLTLKDLHREYSQHGFEFVGVFPNASSTPQTLSAFQKRYNLPFPVKLDVNNQISHAFGARITPEVVIVEKASNEILYQGRIDNTFFALGRRRSITTTQELREALAAIKARQKIKVTKTEAVGCLITPQKGDDSNRLQSK